MSCHVYGMITSQAAHARYIKFGVAADVDKRLIQVQTGCPLRIAVVLAAKLPSVSDAMAVECLLHNEHWHDRTWGEWFKFSANMGERQALEAIRLACERHLGPVNIERTECVKRRRELTASRRPEQVVGDVELSGVSVFHKTRKSLISVA